MRSQVPSGAVLRAFQQRCTFRESVLKVPPIGLACRRYHKKATLSRQSDALVEAKERAVQLRRDLHFFVQHSQSTTPTCQSLHTPVPWGACRQSLACRARRSLDAPPRRRARA